MMYFFIVPSENMVPLQMYSQIEELACCGSCRGAKSNGIFSAMSVCQGGILSSEQQLFLSVLCCRVYKSNSQSCCTGRSKRLFCFMFSSYGGCDKLLPHKFSVLTHHSWTCLCNGTTLWS